MSGFNLTGSISQNLTLDSSNFNKDFPEEWPAYVERNTYEYKRFAEYWISKRTAGYDVFFLRFEDLIGDMAGTLRQVFHFVLGQPVPEGSLMSERIS